MRSSPTFRAQGWLKRLDRHPVRMPHRRNATAALKLLALSVLMPLVFVGLGLARLAVIVVPFPRLSRRFGQSMGAVALVPLATPSQARKASFIGRTIRRVAPRTPWESNCLPQAILARTVLGTLGIPYALHLGLRPRPIKAGDPVAHAWVACGRVFVTGGNGFANYPVVAVFVAPACVPAAGDAAISPSPEISDSRWRS